MKSKFILLLSFLLSSSVFADAPVTAAQGGMMGQFIMIGLIFALMYFLVFRPQNKKAKEHKNMLQKITKGDEIVTAGGILGTVVKNVNNFFVLELSKGVEITVQKNAVSVVLPKGTIKSIN